MKILKIIHGFPPECSGGTESYVFRLAKALIGLGHEVEVLAGSMQGSGIDASRAEVEHELVDGIPVHRLHRSGLYVDNWEKSLAPEVGPRLEAVLRDFAPDLVHVHHWVRLSRNLVEICHDVGIPTVCTLHDVLSVHPVGFRITEESRREVRFGDPSEDRLAPILSGHKTERAELEAEYELYKQDMANELALARRLIVPSLAHRDTILDFQPGLEGRFRVLPHGNISDLEPRPPRGRSNREPGRLRIGHWGHLSRLKGIDLLLEAVQQCEHKDAIHLDLFGEVVFPDERPLVDRLAEGLDITWHGGFVPTDLAKVPMDLAVIPTRCNESWSFVLDEAILLGLPVLGPNRGAIGERLRRRGGLFDADDAADLARRIDAVVEDPGQLDSWARRNPPLVPMHEHTEGVIGVYKEVLSSHAPLPRTPDALRAHRTRVRTFQLERQKSARAHQDAHATSLQSDLKTAQATMAEMDHFHREKDKVITDLQQRLEEAERKAGGIDEAAMAALIRARDADQAGAEERTTAALAAIEQRLESVRAEARRRVVEARLARDAEREEMARELQALRLARKGAEEGEALLAAAAPPSVQEASSPRVVHELSTSILDAIEQLTRVGAESDSDLGALIGSLPKALEALSDALRAESTGATAARAHGLSESLDTSRMAVETTLRDTRDRLFAALAHAEEVAQRGTAEASLQTHLVAAIEDLLEQTAISLRRTAQPPRPERGRGQRLKILYVVHQFLPRHVAGTELYTYALASELAQRHDVVILTAESDRSRERFELSRKNYDGLPVWEMVHNYQWHDFHDTYDCPEADAIFRRVLREEKPDIVHIQHLHHFSANFVTIAKMHGAPVVYTLHDYGLICPNDGQMRKPDGTICDGCAPQYCTACVRHPVDPERRPPLLPRGLKPGLESIVPSDIGREVRLRRAGGAIEDPVALAQFERHDYLKRVMEGVDLFISPSAFLRERMIEAGMMEPERIIVSDNGYDLAPWRSVERTEGTGLRVGFVGTIGQHKGVHVLIDAMNGIDDPRISCQIWGDLAAFGEYGEEIVKRSTNQRTLFMGPFTPTSLATVLANFDILVVPSLWYENSPLTVHEAALARVPVLASDIGGLAEYVKEEVTGRRFEMGNAEHLRERIVEFLERPLANFDPTALQVKPIAQDALETEQRYLELRTRALTMADVRG